ncbi:MAG: hypothetical protein M1297_06175 [Nitrospirae bacterium]|jgi:hypothetical protein|nr:hypothetical protein [Nitrospirota bacterium]
MKIAHVTPLLLRERFRQDAGARISARDLSGVFSETGLILVDSEKNASVFFGDFPGKNFSRCSSGEDSHALFFVIVTDQDLIDKRKNPS